MYSNDDELAKTRNLKGKFSNMIARIWNGKTHTDEADAYTQFLLDKAIPDYQETEGYVSHHFLKRKDGNIVHFKLITFWESVEVIRNFAGPDIEQAKYYSEDIDFLLDFPDRVKNYEVFETGKLEE